MFAVTVVPYPYLFNEAFCWQDDLSGFCCLDKGVDVDGLDVCEPVAPLFMSCDVISAHNVIFDRLPSSS